MKAAEIMSRDVLTMNTESTVLEAARTLLRHRVSGLPVIDGNGKLVGVLTEGDLMRRAETRTERQRSRWLELLLGPGRAAADYTAAHARKVGTIMTEEVISIGPETDLDEAVGLMERHQIKRLPVIANGKLVGIVSRADFLRALIAEADRERTTPLGDEEIAKRVQSELDLHSWAPRASLRFSVKDGIIELTGSITDERERAALRVMCENIAGVKGVVDRLVWVDPLSGITIEPPDANH
jgi:CBS domain-containing protein